MIRQKAARAGNVKENAHLLLNPNGAGHSNDRTCEFD